jgi:hypothetical protein
MLQRALYSVVVHVSTPPFKVENSKDIHFFNLNLNRQTSDDKRANVDATGETQPKPNCIQLSKKCLKVAARSRRIDDLSSPAPLLMHFVCSVGMASVNLCFPSFASFCFFDVAPVSF